MKLEERTKRYYVYILRKPNGLPFYVGKGTGQRAETHIAEARFSECNCRKCQTIRRITRTGRKVIIDCVFETDSEKEALRKERAIIKELSAEYHLCNKSGNRYYERPPMPKPLIDMTSDELNIYFDRIDIPPKERREIRKTWLYDRVDYLHHQWQIARRRQMFERAVEIDKEIEELIGAAGRGWQEKLPL